MHFFVCFFFSGFCKFNDDSNTTLECVPFCVIEGMESCDCTGKPNPSILTCHMVPFDVFCGVIVFLR